MRHLITTVVIGAVALAGVASPAFAGNDFAKAAWQSCTAETVRSNPWAVSFGSTQTSNLSAADWGAGASVATIVVPVDFRTTETADQSTQGRRRPIAFEYSEAYKVRAKVHKFASLAMWPLFIGEYIVGADLYNHPENRSSSKRGLHSTLAASTGVLFGINTITGVWNLIEARKDPNHRTLRTIHGILMMVADAGFAATGAVTPENENEHGGAFVVQNNNRSTHRTLAISSMGVAVVSYLLMLFGGK